MKDKYENQMLENWHSYKDLEGKLSFEEFIGHKLNVQSMLIRMRKWQVSKILELGMEEGSV